MKNLITYLKALWRAWGNLQSSDVRHDCRLTVGSPSGLDAKWKQNPFMRFAVVLTLIFTIGVGQMWSAQIASLAPENGKSFIIALFNNNKYYALPANLTNTGVTPAGLECTLDANNKVTAISGCSSPNECLWYFESATGGFHISYVDAESTKRYLYKNGTTGKNYNISANPNYPEKSIWAFTAGTVNTVTVYSVKTTKSDATKHTVLKAKNSTAFQVNGTSNAYVITLLEVAASGPTITKSSSMTTLTYENGSPVAQSFIVGGTNLTHNVTVTAPTDYEVCLTENGTYTSSVELSKGSGTLSNTTVYIRLQSGLSAGDIASRNISISSEDATTQTIAVTGSVPYTITWMANGYTHATTYVAVGSTLALPATDPVPNSCGCTGKAFYGWYGLGTSYAHASNAPAIAAAGDAVSADKTYYAVFADAEEGEDVYTEVSSITEGTYVMVSEYTSNTYRYMPNTTSSGSNPALGSGITMSTTAGVTTLTNAVTNDMLWDFSTGETSGYYYVRPHGSSTIGLGTTNATGANIRISTTYVNTEWSFTTSASYGWEITTGSMWLSVYADNAWRNYGNNYTNQNGTFYIFKQSGGYTYSNYTTTCCTNLASINGSVNLSTSSTGSSVTVNVKTAGVGAYGDANNVSGYDFKLYTASAGGSAAATYSSDSKAGTSHEFTGLTPLTQYWVTVRPIGSGSYCNTTAESDRVAIYTCPGSPNHVDVSGRWDRFGGETISLTAAAYATAGTGTAIPAAKITGYQWQKWYNSQWNNISNAGTTSGATTNNLQITSCSNENSGSYRCVVSTVAGCDIASDGFQVKVYVLECYNSGTTVYNFTRTGDTQAGTVEIELSASTNYGYKVHADNDYYGNSGTVNEDVVNWEMSTGVSNNLTVASGLGGTFTFAIDYSTGGNNSTEGIPEISVTYPRKTIFLTPGVWNTGGAKFAFYYFRKVGETVYGEGFTDFITANDCGSSAEIPQWNGVKINAVRLNSNTTASDLTNSANHYAAAWAKKWNQTGDITITSNNSISITGWGDGDSPYDYGTYAVPTYTISYATGSTTYTGGNAISGSKANESKTCGVSFTLPSSAVFTTTGYTQTGWATSDGGSQAYAFSGSYTTNAAQAFYPAWTANTHSLTWSANGGDALTGDYTSGTVAYGTTITAPNTPTRSGYTFAGWHNGTSVVTPATTMPDNDLTYTAQWQIVADHYIDNIWGVVTADQTGTYTRPTLSDQSPGGLTDCQHLHYHFVGWITKAKFDAGTAISDGDIQTTGSVAANGTTYYAVWAKEGAGSAEVTVLSETFDNERTEDNTQAIDGDTYSTTFPGNTDKAYEGAYGKLKFSSSKVNGYITTGELNLSSAFTVTFDMIQWSSDNGSITVTAYDAEDNALESHTADSYGTNRTLSFGAATSTTTLQFVATNRVYMDNVVVKTGGAITYTDYVASCGATYDITLDKNGGTNNGSAQVTANATVLNGGFTAPVWSGHDVDYYMVGSAANSTKIAEADGTLASSVTVSGTPWTDADGKWVKGSGATFYAKWKNAEYNIVYRDQNNEAFSGTHGTGYPTTHTYGTATTLVNPTRPGYTFAGWYTASNCESGSVTSLEATAYTSGPITLYAKWTMKTYTVTWVVNGSTEASQNNVTYGTFYSSLTEEPEVANNALSSCGSNKFIGWVTREYTAEGGTKTAQYDAYAVTDNTIVGDNSHTFYAMFATEEGNSFSLTGENGSTQECQIYATVSETNHYATGDVTGNKILSTTEVESAGTYVFTKLADGEYSIKLKGSSYFIMKSSGNTDFGTTAAISEDAHKWVISTSAAGKGTWSIASKGTNTRGFIYGVNQSKFGTYQISDADGNNETYYNVEIGTSSLVDYRTGCCDEKITLTVSDATSGAGGEVALTWNGAAKSSSDQVSTCSEGTLVATVTANPNYTLTAMAISGTNKSITIVPADLSTGLPTTDAKAYTVTVPSLATGPLTITPAFTRTYTVTYNLDGGETAGSTANANYLSSATVTFVTPNPTKTGYDFAGWVVNKEGGGTQSATSTNFIMPADNVTVTAQWTPKALSSLTVTPTTAEVYVGQYVQIPVTYTPADVLTKGYTLVSTPSYCVITGSTNTTLKITGGRGGVTITENKTETVSIQADADNTKTASVTVTIKPLPVDHFIDLVHGVEFADQSATIVDNALSASYTAQGHADVSAPVEGNACEKGHLHLIGWIESTWADAHLTATMSEITSAVDGESNPLFHAVYSPMTASGKTYYAVWAHEEE